MDKITKELRSRNMAAIKSKNTIPELLLRKQLFKLGFRYRIHYKINTINNDIAFPSKKKIINVHGCFWHQHPNCIEASKPKTNPMFWHDKLKKNVERDRKNAEILEHLGWRIITVWECELVKDMNAVLNKVLAFISAKG